MRTLKIPKWNVVKSRFPKFCKRVGAFISACFIASYSLLTAPLFGVHAVDAGHSAGVIDTIKEFLYEVGQVAIPMYCVENPIASIVGVTALNIASNVYDSTKHYDSALDAWNVVKTEVDLSSTYGKTGYCKFNDQDATVTCYTLNSEVSTYGTFGLDSVDGLNYHRLMTLTSASENVTVYMNLQPYDMDGNSWGSGDTITFTSSYLDSELGTFQFRYDFNDYYGEPTKHHFKVNFMFNSSSGTRQYLPINVTSYWGASSYYDLQLYFRKVSNYVNFPTYTNFAGLVNSFNNNSSLSRRVHIAGYLNSPNDIPTVGPDQKYPFPSTGVTKINENNVYNYTQNVSYPYIVNNYTVWQTLPPPSDFEPEPTEPTGDTISPSETTTGTVVIIDPFTLPPEWLEDNAELETDHYELDPGLWQDPLDAIEQYKQQVSPLQEGEDDSDFWRNNELLAPADVTSAMYAFQEFCVDLLQESGLLVVIASCLAFGLIIRLISLK